MGDIIWAIILVFIIAFVTAGYIKCRKEKSVAELCILWFVVASMWGVIALFLNDARAESNITFMKLVYFIIQCFSCLIYFIKPRSGILLFMLTLLVQIPILDTKNLTYRNQTLVSINFRNYPSKIIDIEPGSYIVYLEHKNKDSWKQTSSGINLIPCLIIVLLFRNSKTNSTIIE